MRWRRRKDSDLERARVQAKESTARAHEELQTSRANLSRSQAVAAALRLHNQANRYDTWLEQVLRGAP
ncbi:DUF7620 family protein [Actinacidiphila glaucinigra]|uniref:DUF7620 family protein n=1 Tax=Actinacidiphila glaucinigra TaxID=235986 RepID=UPI00366AE415